jgi:hypothetical protein
VEIAIATGFAHHVNVGIVDAVLLGVAGADFETDGYRIAAIYQVVAIGRASRKGGALARAHDLLTLVCDEYDFAGNDINEFVFV